MSGNGGREIVVRLSFGELHNIAQSAGVALRRRAWSVLRTELWSQREARRRGTWRPFTLGDYVVLRRQRMRLATAPQLRGERPWWRHTERGIARRSR